MPHRWERRPPPKIKKRRIERAILGGMMGFAAFVLERRVVKALKKKGLDDEFEGDAKPGFTAGTAERAKD